MWQPEDAAGATPGVLGEGGSARSPHSAAGGTSLPRARPVRGAAVRRTPEPVTHLLRWLVPPRPARWRPRPRLYPKLPRALTQPSRAPVKMLDDGVLARGRRAVSENCAALLQRLHNSPRAGPGPDLNFTTFAPDFSGVGRSSSRRPRVATNDAAIRTMSGPRTRRSWTMRVSSHRGAGLAVPSARAVERWEDQGSAGIVNMRRAAPAWSAYFLRLRRSRLMSSHRLCPTDAASWRAIRGGTPRISAAAWAERPRSLISNRATRRPTYASSAVARRARSAAAAIALLLPIVFSMASPGTPAAKRGTVRGGGGRTHASPRRTLRDQRS